MMPDETPCGADSIDDVTDMLAEVVRYATGSGTPQVRVSSSGSGTLAAAMQMLSRRGRLVLDDPSDVLSRALSGRWVRP